jgi:hypothetical protein
LPAFGAGLELRFAFTVAAAAPGALRSARAARDGEADCGAALSAPRECDVLLGDAPASDPSSAQATPPEKQTAPTPNATARPPTRPTSREARRSDTGISHLRISEC